MTRQDEFGSIEYDERGYAHRGPEYAQRFELLDKIAGLDCPWRKNKDGTFTSVYPVYSVAQRQLAARTAIKMKQSVQPTMTRFGELPQSEAPKPPPVDPEVLTGDEKTKKDEIPWKWLALGSLGLWFMSR